MLFDSECRTWECRTWECCRPPWPASAWPPGGPQQGFENQPLRDRLEAERRPGRWNGEPPPHLPDDVVAATSERYLNAFRRITGVEWMWRRSDDCVRMTVFG